MLILIYENDDGYSMSVYMNVFSFRCSVVLLVFFIEFPFGFVFLYIPWLLLIPLFHFVSYNSSASWAALMVFYWDNFFINHIFYFSISFVFVASCNRISFSRSWLSILHSSLALYFPIFKINFNEKIWKERKSIKNYYPIKVQNLLSF